MVPPRHFGPPPSYFCLPPAPPPKSTKPPLNTTISPLPLLLSLLNTYPPLTLPLTILACSYPSPFVSTLPFTICHLSSTLSILLNPCIYFLPISTRHLPLILHLSPHTTCPLIIDTIHLSAYPYRLHFHIYSSHLPIGHFPPCYSICNQSHLPP
jgi:hypothetical protein